jgi:hypothetical protein
MRQAASVAVLVLLSLSLSFAQTAPRSAGAGVPPVIRFSGTLAVAPGRVPVTFGLYQEETGGEPLWAETQTLLVDAAGRYSVVLGLTTALPAELFLGGQARWLDVAVEGLAPQPRRLLVSVPYALKAADADTVGGKPVSAFVFIGDKTGVGADGLTYVDTRVLSSGLASGATGQAPGGAGTANYIGLFTDTTTLGNSVIYQTPGGSIGVNTVTPLAGFHAVSGASPVAYYDVYSNALGALPVVYRVARGTPSVPAPVQTDDILGGLAVRGYGTTGFSSGRGQVMFKAAENWTDTANGTYLQFTTTPLGSVTWAERIRVTPAGNVGIGTPTPGQKLSVAGTVESTTGGFKFPDGTTQATALSLAANTFTATQTISSGNLAMPATASAGSGVVTLGGQPFLHGYGATTYGNTFLGLGAGTFAGTGNGGNVGVGGEALMSNTSGQYNTAIGLWSLSSNTIGGGNVAVGQGALYRNVSASYNTAVGYAALGFATTGGTNAAFGGYALANATGQGNSAFGQAALTKATTPNGNSAFGYGSLAAATTAYNSSAFGYQSLNAVSTASHNSAFGYQALSANASGSANAAFGTLAMALGNAGAGNSGFGYSVLRSNTADNNSAFGYRALYSNTTGVGNDAFGSNALTLNTTGASNAGFGTSALAANTTASYNTAFGHEALTANTTGYSNTASGSQALAANTTGANNTAAGYAALGANTIGDHNTASGVGALHNNTGGGTNTASGASALFSNTLGSNNTANGVSALGANTTGHSNIGIGYGAGSNLTTGSYDIDIGHPGVPAEANTIRIGTPGDQTRTFVAGIRGVTTGYSDAIPVLIDTNGQLGTASSSRRVKDDITDMAAASGGLMKLRPVTFYYKSDQNPAGRTLQYGLIAEEVAEVYPGLVAHSADGQIQTVMYQFLPPMLLNEVQKQQRTIDAQAARLEATATALKAENDALKAQVESLRAQVQQLAAAIERR